MKNDNVIQRLSSPEEDAARRMKLAEHPVLVGRYDLIRKVLDHKLSISEVEAIVATAQAAAARGSR